jgi:hypothetical protein
MRSASKTLALASLGLALAACETFQPAPSARLMYDVNGTMHAAPNVPLVVQFSEPVVPSSIKLEVIDVGAPGSIDADGNLFDEQNPPKLDQFKQSTLIAYDAKASSDTNKTYGATFQLDGAESALTIQPDKAFDVSVPYMLLIEPGLESHTGHATVPRNRFPFVYQLAGGGRTRLPSGFYYFLMNVDFLAQQIRTYADIQVDPSTGDWKGLFTAAVRVPALDSRPGCPSSCPAATPICQLYDKTLPACVKPSDKQTNVDQFADFLPQTELPSGFTFGANGFAKDAPDGTTDFGTATFDIDIHVGSGNVDLTAKDAQITGTFSESTSEPGRFVGSGSISVSQVAINGNSPTPTKGTFTAMSLTDDEVKQVQSFGYPIPTVSP